MLSRRRFFTWLGGMVLVPARRPAHSSTQSPASPSATGGALTLFLCGDVMTGRGIDQILPYHNRPQIHEPFVRDARDYVAMAERRHGAIPWPVGFDYVWGEALDELARVAPDVRIVNLETAITTHAEFQPKGINYRMHPGNIPVLTAAQIDCCALANNHVLDWGAQGLADTLDTLHAAGISTAGAGRDLAQAQAPAVMPLPGRGRVLVFALGSEYSGIGCDWAAHAARAGIDLLPDLSAATVDAIAARVADVKRPGDVAIASIHWGGNWGYQVPAAHRRFAHGLIDRAGIDVVHGHSSHHPKGIEIHRERLVIYGCGDFLNDYEGIAGHDAYRPDLGLMYFPTLDVATGHLLKLQLTPTRIRRFRIERATRDEAAWQAQVLNREGRQFGTGVRRDGEAGLSLEWVR